MFLPDEARLSETPVYFFHGEILYTSSALVTLVNPHPNHHFG